MTSELRADAELILRALQPGTVRDDFLSFVTVHDDAMQRECGHGHLTASALIVDAQSRRALLMLHRKVGRWLQMGGHCEEGDVTMRDAAAREAREESGITGLVMSDSPVNLDRHRVRCDGRDLDHLDVQFLALAPTGASAIANDESLGLHWFAFDEVPREDTAVLRLVERAREYLEASDT